MAKSLALTTAAINMDETPFLAGREAVAINMTAAGIALTGSDDGTTYTAIVTVPTLGISDITLPKYVKAASAGVYILGGA